MTQVTIEPAARDFSEVADAVLAHYRSAPAGETERAIAMLALWALDAIEGGSLTPQDADAVFTRLDIEIGEASGGPELSESASQILLEGMTFHDWNSEFSVDPGRVRTLAFAILRSAV